jgi:hypothetical protein
MPLLHKAEKLHKGDLIVLAEPQAHVYVEVGMEPEPETTLVLARHKEIAMGGIFHYRQACIAITPYLSGGYRFLNRHPCGGRALIWGEFSDLLGRVSGTIDCSDTYAMEKYLRRVAKRYHAAIYDSCFQVWYAATQIEG